MEGLCLIEGMAYVTESEEVDLQGCTSPGCTATFCRCRPDTDGQRAI